MKKERIITKAKRIALTATPAVILLVIFYFIYKSLELCYEALCKCGMEEHDVQNYLIVQGSLLLVHVALRIVGCLRQQAIRFTPEIRFFGYLFAVMPLFIQLWQNFGPAVVQQTLLEAPIVLGIELLITILLRIYDNLPPGQDGSTSAKPRPRQTPTA